jgi:hypothetical protein
MDSDEIRTYGLLVMSPTPLIATLMWPIFRRILRRRISSLVGITWCDRHSNIRRLWLKVFLLPINLSLVVKMVKSFPRSLRIRTKYWSILVTTKSGPSCSYTLILRGKKSWACKSISEIRQTELIMRCQNRANQYCDTVWSWLWKLMENNKYKRN